VQFSPPLCPWCFLEGQEIKKREDKLILQSYLPYLKLLFFFIFLCKPTLATEIIAYGTWNQDFYRLNLEDCTGGNIRVVLSNRRKRYVGN